MPTPPRPVTPKDREYLRALRAAEMTLWAGIQTAELKPELSAREAFGKLFGKLSQPEQKRELALLLILAGAAALAVGVAFVETGSFIQSWAEFVQNVRGF